MTELEANLQRNLVFLCKDCFGRHCGSPAEAKAAGYLAQVFKDYGYSRVDQEPFPVTGWDFQGFEFTDESAGNPPVPVPGAVPCYFSRAVDCSGPLLWIGPDRINHLDGLDVKDRLCLVEYFTSSRNLRGRNAIAEQLDALGAAAAVFISDPEYHTPCAASTKIVRSPYLRRLGVCAVAEEGAYHLAARRDGRFHLRIQADVAPATSRNIVAFRPGATARSAVFGAHYDTTPLTEGAQDNASGTAALLELARLLRTAAPEWNLTFAAFSAEEYCRLDTAEKLPRGSEAFLERRPQKDWSFFLNLDSVGKLFADTTLHVGRREKLPGFTSRYPLAPGKGDGDDRGFDRAGIPTLWYYSRPRFWRFHTALDTLDTLCIPALAEIVADAADVSRQLLENL